MKFEKYRTIILSVVAFGCETWCLKLRQERRLRVFENRVLRTIFGHKKDAVTRAWRKLNNEELKCSSLLTECYSSYQINKNDRVI